MRYGYAAIGAAGDFFVFKNHFLIIFIDITELLQMFTLVIQQLVFVMERGIVIIYFLAEDSADTLKD